MSAGKRLSIRHLVTTTAAGSRGPAVLPPDDESLIEATRERVGRGLRGRELAFTSVAAVAFVAVATTLAATLPTERGVSPAVAAVLVVAYALALRVEFEVAIGAAVPSQLVLVPMLFLLPARDVPLFVAAGYFVAYLPNHFRRAWHPNRLLVHLASSWYAVGPAVVLALAGEPSPDWRRHGGIFVGALAAQFALDL